MDPREYALGWLRAVRDEINGERVTAEEICEPDSMDRAEAYDNAVEIIEEAIRKIEMGEA